MSWSVIDNKMNSLNAGLNQWELKTLEREFSEITSHTPKIAQLARSIRGILFVDLAYAMMRHRDWLQVPVFSALMIDFLQLDYGIPRGDAEIICHDMIEAAMELGLYRPRSICCDDREFLTWAYVCAAGARDEDALDADLGLGTAVLRKLRDGLQAIERVESQVFIPEYDAMLATIVLELGHECKATAWAMDFHRMRYAMLAAAGDAAQPFVLEENIPELLSVLVRIGKGESQILIDRPALREIFTAAGIVVEESKARRSKTRGVELTDYGYSLTAYCAAMTMTLSDLPKKFLQLSNRWQEAIVRRSAHVSADFLEALIAKSLNKISPEVLEAIISRLADLAPTKLNGELVRRMLSDANLGWHKAAIMRALKKVHPSRDLLDAVASELTSSISPGVRLAAGGLLDQWTDRP